MVESVELSALCRLLAHGDMVESVDTGDLKSPEACRLVPVQVWLSPLANFYCGYRGLTFLRHCLTIPMARGGKFFIY